MKTNTSPQNLILTNFYSVELKDNMLLVKDYKIKDNDIFFVFEKS